MPSFQNIFLAFAATTATVQAEHLRAVWSAGSFSTITGPQGQGGGSGHSSGLTILNDDDVAIYEASYPADYSPCFHTDGGRTFEIEGDCWDTPFQFHCQSKLSGSPESCAVNDSDGKELGKGDGKSETTFIGIAIGIDATCVVEFESNGGGCPADNSDAGALHATGKGI